MPEVDDERGGGGAWSLANTVSHLGLLGAELRIALRDGRVMFGRVVKATDADGRTVVRPWGSTSTIVLSFDDIRGASGAKVGFVETQVIAAHQRVHGCAPKKTPPVSKKENA